MKKKLTAKPDIGLKQKLLEMLTPSLFLNNKEYDDFLALVQSGKITKDKNPIHHCGVFFIPFNPKTKEILIVDHKKAKQWIVPGGHIETGEMLEATVKREAKEELGITIKTVTPPFLFSVMPLRNNGYPCRAHYDAWYLIEPKQKLNIDFTEFHDVRWVNKKTAKKFITHQTYLQALDKIKAF